MAPKNDEDFQPITSTNKDRGLDKQSGPMSTEYIAHSCAICAQCVFSGWHIVGHLVFLSSLVNPFVFVFYRESVAAVILYMSLSLKGVDVKVDRADVPRFITVGCCQAGTAMFGILALTLISATRFAIFQPSIPCVTILISIVAGMERVSLKRSLGITLAVMGALVVVGGGSNTPDAGTNPANMETDVKLGTFFVFLL